MKRIKSKILKIVAILFLSTGTIGIIIVQQNSSQKIRGYLDQIENKQDTINRIDNRIMQANNSWNIAADNSGKIILYNEIHKLQVAEILKAARTRNPEIISLMDNSSTASFLDSVQEKF